MMVNTVEMIVQTSFRWITLSLMLSFSLGPLLAGGDFCQTLTLLEVEP